MSTIGVYELLPLMLRLKDQESSYTPDGTVLQKILDALQEQVDETEEFILGLRNLINLDITQDFILSLIVKAMGGTPLPNDTEFNQREMAKEQVNSYKIKGTVLSWVRMMKLRTVGNFSVVELYKSELDERTSYSIVCTPSHPYRSSRVLFRGTSYGMGAVIESLPPWDNPVEQECEDHSGLVPDQLGYASSVEILNLLEEVRPIHVWTPVPICITSCEDTIKDTCDGGEGSKIILSFREPSSVSAMRPCKTSCELGCETACEEDCESSCQRSCELGCEPLCESSCQAGFEGVCQTACQTYCEDTCEASCEPTCQQTCQVSRTFNPTFVVGDTLELITNCTSVCQTGCQEKCEVFCELSCESTCEEDCQARCEDECQISCEFFCQEACEAACETPCQSYCQLACENTCQTACQMSCQKQCQSGCQNYEESCTAFCQTMCQTVVQERCEDACENGCQTQSQMGDCAPSGGTCTLDLECGTSSYSNPPFMEDACTSTCESSCQLVSQVGGCSTSNEAGCSTNEEPGYGGRDPNPPAHGPCEMIAEMPRSKPPTDDEDHSVVTITMTGDRLTNVPVVAYGEDSEGNRVAYWGHTDGDGTVTFNVPPVELTVKPVWKEYPAYEFDPEYEVVDFGSDSSVELEFNSTVTGADMRRGSFVALSRNFCGWFGEGTVDEPVDIVSYHRVDHNNWERAEIDEALQWIDVELDELPGDLTSVFKNHGQILFDPPEESLGEISYLLLYDRDYRYTGGLGTLIAWSPLQPPLTVGSGQTLKIPHRSQIFFKIMKRGRSRRDFLGDHIPDLIQRPVEFFMPSLSEVLPPECASSCVTQKNIECSTGCTSSCTAGCTTSNCQTSCEGGCTGSCTVVGCTSGGCTSSCTAGSCTSNEEYPCERVTFSTRRTWTWDEEAPTTYVANDWYPSPFTGTADDPITELGWDDSYGNPAGSIYMGAVAKSGTFITATWRLRGTWEDIFGVPSNCIVTGVRMVGIETRCSAFSGVTEAFYGDEDDTAGIYAGLLCNLTEDRSIWKGRRVNAAEGLWVFDGPSSVKDVISGYKEPTQEVQFQLMSHFKFGAGTAGTRLYIDNLTIEVFYQQCSLPYVDPYSGDLGGECSAGSCTVLCQSWCESGCQLTCTTRNEFVCQKYCESSCQSACISTCQVACQADCEHHCEGDCQASRQGDFCAVACVASCTTICTVGHCQAGCVAGCEDYCTAYCEQSCQMATAQVDCSTYCQWDCQASCQDSCQFSCENTCEMTEQSDGCTNTCQFHCQSTCEKSCEWTCQVICQNQCETTTQTYGCVSACQVSAQSNCDTLTCQTQNQVFCNTTCEAWKQISGCGDTCQVSCEGACQLQAQTSGCQTRCQSSCEGNCQSVCQIACELSGCQANCEDCGVTTNS